MRRWAAALDGALEGFVEGLERYELATKAEASIHEAGHIVREAGGEARAQAQTPEMQQAGAAISSAATRTADVASRARDATRERMVVAGESTRTRVDSAREGLRETIDHTKAAVNERVETAKEAARDVKEDVKYRADAVKESAQKAREAPPKVRSHLKQGIQSWKRGLVTSLALFALVGLLALTAWIVLTVGLVYSFALIMPLGFAALVVAVIYLIAAGIGVAAAKRAKNRSRIETRRHIDDSKEEVRDVVRPLRRAAAGRRGAI